MSWCRFPIARAATCPGMLSMRWHILQPVSPLQIGECLRCLRHVAAQRLPMTEALRTLPALDTLLRQLTAAAVEEVQRRQAARAYLLPFTAAALGSAFTVRLAALRAGPSMHVHV